MGEAAFVLRIHGKPGDFDPGLFSCVIYCDGFSTYSYSASDLPPAIVDAINRQTEQFYLIQEYKFRVEREAQESKRKQIEANGIAVFQQTVSK